MNKAPMNIIHHATPKIEDLQALNAALARLYEAETEKAAAMEEHNRLINQCKAELKAAFETVNSPQGRLEFEWP